MDEHWLPVVGYEGLYEVSDLGRIRSLDRVTQTAGGYARRTRGRVLRAVKVQSSRYMTVSMYKDGPGTVRQRQACRDIHVMVLEAFAGPRPGPTYHARHLDGNALNNVLANLAWGTREENWEDRRRHGRDPYSAKTHCKRGHPFDEANTRVTYWPDGRFRGRQCKACRGRGPYR